MGNRRLSTDLKKKTIKIVHTPYIHIYHIEQKVYIKEVGKVNKRIICFKHFSYYINYPSMVYNAVYII